MSLVGTRPPTVDEWEKYELHHRREMRENRFLSYVNEYSDGYRMF